jgi:hypothetical protein
MSSFHYQVREWRVSVRDCDHYVRDCDHYVRDCDHYVESVTATELVYKSNVGDALQRKCVLKFAEGTVLQQHIMCSVYTSISVPRHSEYPVTPNTPSLLIPPPCTSWKHCPADL